MADIEMTRMPEAAAAAPVGATGTSVAARTPAEAHAAAALEANVALQANPVDDGKFDHHASSPHLHEPAFQWNAFSTWVFVFETALILLYGLCTDFSPAVDTRTPSASPAGALDGPQYSMFQDTHVMMLIGFGFLYANHRLSAWSGVGWNFLITVLVVQWAALLNGFWENVHEHKLDSRHGFPSIPLTIGNFIRADYSAATVLISFGAVIGRVSPGQMLAMLFWEVICSTANEVIGFHALHVTDPGGSMYIHTFGAAFGLALSYVYGDRSSTGPQEVRAAPALGRSNSTIAMIGTLFLFCFWPSFNGAMLRGSAQHRIAINTLLSICCSAATTFMMSKAVFRGRRFDMEHIQNSTLAGGVVIGAACDMLSNPWGAMLAGSVAGAVSTLGFSYFTPALKNRGLTDTCGILNLHFIPGVIGGIASAIAAAGVHSGSGAGDFTVVENEFPGREHRSALTQGGYQMAVVVISVVFGLTAGALGGLIIKAPVFEPKMDGFYEDAADWNVPHESETEVDERILRAVRAYARELEGARPAAISPSAKASAPTSADPAPVALDAQP